VVLLGHRRCQLEEVIEISSD